jgi:predicted TIM-barrel fold metal-dependent hydrolase
MNEAIEPIRRAPAGACDAHFHVFGDPARFPYRDPKLRYQPPLAPLEDYLVRANRIGIERFVFVQPSAYLRDNDCQLQAMAKMGDRCRGIVDIEDDAPDSLFESLSRQNVRGIRVNVSPIHAPDAELASRLRPRIDALEQRCKDFGWHLDFLLPGWLTESLLDRMARLEVDFSLAHLGMFAAAAGPEQPGFKRLLELVSRGSGRCWVKLTGYYRISRRPPDYGDVRPMIEALASAAPDRLIWGSDDPHLSFAHETGTVALYNLTCQWTTPEQLQKILVDNPARLFGFSAAA